MKRIENAQTRSHKLKDARMVRIRTLAPDDAERLYWFYGGISEVDRRYLRVDVRDRDLIIDRVQHPKDPKAHRIIAENETEIIAEASLDTHAQGWDHEIGELRILVSPNYRGKGLGRILARELYLMAIERRLRKLEARAMRPQTAARRIFRKLGFTEEAVLPDHVTDMKGRAQDLIVMSLDVEDLKRDLKQVYSSSDWRRHR